MKLEMYAAAAARRRSLALLLAVVVLLAWFGWMQSGDFVMSKSPWFNEEDQQVPRRLEVVEKSASRLQQETEQRLEELENLAGLLKEHLAESVQFLPLKDESSFKALGENGVHGFMSDIRGRGHLEGPPEFFNFPSNLSRRRLLCFKGNHTSDGTKNSYGYAHRQALPEDALLLPGTTLISDSYFDFDNPWHAMYNLIQFVQWKLDNGCASGDRMLLYHWGEIRQSMGYWISNVLGSTKVTTNVGGGAMNYDGGRPVCFERAVVSRMGIGGVPSPLLEELYREVRCQARRRCGVVGRISRTGGAEKTDIIEVTLVVRDGARGFVNVTEWEDVVKSECERAAAGRCRWSIMRVSQLSFCQQVQAMSRTDILLSVHGAQLTNMIFMSPGSRVLEMFPRGWLELAGHGQFIYMNLANWVGLQHEGYWRDEGSSADCPTPHDAPSCFAFYKDRPVGINATYVSEWLGRVIGDFNRTQLQLQNAEEIATTCRCN